MSFCSFDGQTLTEQNLIDGKYRLGEMLGEGGMGQVYRAEHIHLKSACAIKLLNPLFVSNDNAVERFRREAEATAQLHHPNAIQVTDFGLDKESGAVYFVMELLDGLTLRRHLAVSEVRLTYTEIYSILFQVCSVLEAAHTKGIIHRDLKPENIFLVQLSTNQKTAVTINEVGYQVKVLDFGLAKLRQYDCDNLTSEGKVIGTPNYMSPEQIMGLNVDAGTDVYSAGVILYEMFTRKRPYASVSRERVMELHLSGQPKPMKYYRDDIPEQIEVVVLRALNKERNQRQPSMRQLLTELQHAYQSAGIAVPTQSGEEQLLPNRSSEIMNDIWRRLSVDRPTRQIDKNIKVEADATIDPGDPQCQPQSARLLKPDQAREAAELLDQQNQQNNLTKPDQ